MFFFTQGWPQRTFVQQPRSEMVFGLFVGITTYLLPVFVSCMMYLALILNRKKTLSNRVNPGPAESADNVAAVNGSQGTI